MAIEDRMSKYIQFDKHYCDGVVKAYGEKDLRGFQTSVTSANILEAVALTNGYHGGDSGHGCHSYIEIADLGGTAMSVKVLKKESKYTEELLDTDGESNIRVRLDFFGDTELATLIDALRFMADALETSAEYARINNSDE